MNKKALIYLIIAAFILLNMLWIIWSFHFAGTLFWLIIALYLLYKGASKWND